MRKVSFPNRLNISNVISENFNVKFLSLGKCNFLTCLTFNACLLYDKKMTRIDKFASDLEKIKKRSSSADFLSEARDFFCREYKNSSLAQSFAFWWEQNSPSDSPNVEKLVALSSLLDCKVEGTECFSPSDWKELCQIVNSEAEDLPLDLLNDLMIIFVDKQAI